MKDKDVTKKEEITGTEEPAVKKDPKPLTGIVVNCDKLNVRKEPSKESDVVRIIDHDDQIDIYNDESTDDFYKTSDGYVMKEYVRVVDR